MNQELLNAAKERFPNLTEAEPRMLLAEKSEPANYLQGRDVSTDLSACGRVFTIRTDFVGVSNCFSFEHNPWRLRFYSY